VGRYYEAVKLANKGRKMESIYSQAKPLTVEAFRNRACCKHMFFGYVPPSPEEVESLRKILGYSQAQLGCLLGKKFNRKGCSIVRKWEYPVGHKEYREINYNCWRQMLLAAGVIDLSEELLIADGYKELLD
jgi:hypothetical protein